MPVVEKKGTKKAKSGAGKTNPPPPPPLSTTVRDCMVWPEPRATKGNKKDSTITQKPNVYRSTLVRRDKNSYYLEDGMQNNEEPPNPPPPSLHHPKKDGGTAIEALRGWPGRFVEENSGNVIEYEVFNEEPKTAQTTDGKNSKKKGKKAPSKQEEEHIYIGDLIHQRYHNEYLEKRRKEMAKEQRKKEESASAEKAGRRVALEKSNIKGNRASQLRAIALADRVETSPLDLWKMPRFTKCAQSHLATTTGGNALQRRQGQTGRYEMLDSEGCGGGGGGCCCEYNYQSTDYVDDNEEDIQLGTGGHCDPTCDSPMAIAN